MTKFVVHYKLEVKKGLNADLIKKHIEHLRNLSQKTYFFLCGIVKGKNEAFLIINAESKKDTKAYILQDPLIDRKHYIFDIYELNEANEDNNFLL